MTPLAFIVLFLALGALLLGGIAFDNYFYQPHRLRKLHTESGVRSHRRRNG
jgi:hypothetical protein